MDEGQYLKIRDKKLKEAFLNVFDQIETFQANPLDYLNYTFAKLIELTKAEQLLFESTTEQVANLDVLNIYLIINMLEKHFAGKLSSRLPVIAIYSIYEILITKFARYKHKKLIPLQVHTSSDKHNFGDIEIYTIDNQPFEVVEIKHNIPIDKYLILDIAKKVKKISLNRYYILTTFHNCFTSSEAENEVINYILELKKSQGIDIIANGIISSLKYYLRFIDDYHEFLEAYTKNLINDAKQSTEVKNFHLEIWTEILQNYKIDLQNE
jgi:DNA (cytosine-5)-methyltransferase 1